MSKDLNPGLSGFFKVHVLSVTARFPLKCVLLSTVSYDELGKSAKELLFQFLEWGRLLFKGQEEGSVPPAQIPQAGGPGCLPRGTALRSGRGG